MRVKRRVTCPLSIGLWGLLMVGCSSTGATDDDDYQVMAGGAGGGCSCNCNCNCDGANTALGSTSSTSIGSAAVGGTNNAGGSASADTGTTGSTNSTSSAKATGGINSTSSAKAAGGTNSTSSAKVTGGTNASSSTRTTTGTSNSTSSPTASGGTPSNTTATSQGGTAASAGGSSAAATGGATSTEFVVPVDAKPTPIDSGVDGAFRVNTDTGKLMHNGVPFQVRGGNWFGLEGQDDLARPGAMELYVGAVFWADAANKRTIETTMKEIQTSPLSLNTIRLPVAPQTLVPGQEDGDYTRTDVKIRNNDPTIYAYDNATQALEDFLVQAAKNNLYVILDMHSCSNHIGWRAGKIDDGPPWTDANRENYQYKKEDYYCNQGVDAYNHDKWIADIHTLAKLPKKLGISNIIGIDCFNEPFKYSWSQWADLAKDCYDAIAAEDDNLIVVVEGVSSAHEVDAPKAPEPFGSLATNPNWGENLYGQQFDPIQIPKDRLCFSPHTYGPAVFVQKQFVDQTDAACVGLEDDAAGKAKCKLVVERSNSEFVALQRSGWDDHFGYLKDNNYCVIVGEFGGYKNWPANPVKPSAATIWAHLPSNVRYDWEWQNILVDYLRDKGITDFTYWSINPESGDTGGLYNHAYTDANKSGWGVWQGLDSEKASMLGTLR